MTERQIDLKGMTPLLYRSGYKYQLAEDFYAPTVFCPITDIVTDWVTLKTNGDLTVKAGYAWDGPSGPTIDTVNSMRAALIHDVVYQLMRLKLVGPEWRADADHMLDLVLEHDGMWRPRRWYWLRGVRWFAGGAISPENVKQVHGAP